MSYPGVGVMIGILGGNESSVEAFKQGVGKKILDLYLDEDAGLHFTFADSYRMRLFDGGQSCCEHRYMTTDDVLADFVGSALQSAEVKDGPDVEGNDEVHETAFLHVTTSRGVFVCETHNEHNGYYGGFLIRAEALTP